MGKATVQHPIEVRKEFIAGVETKQLKPIVDARGRLVEILRKDDPIFKRFAQAYMTTVYPRVVKGWHYHKKQTDHFACLNGMIKLVLCDLREDSKTYGFINEFFLGIHHPMMVSVPPFVLHGFQGVGMEEAMVLNLPTELYDYSQPDEFRVDPHENDIPYDWNRIDR
jgi:dTDP-4-dehydrorhamnose 3,5-epimerase